MPDIIVDKNKCTRCHTCSIVCVMGIIERGSDSGFPTIPESKVDYCLKCGHCESFCSQKALTIDFLVDEKINSIPFDGIVDPVNLTFYLKKRRSIRHFTTKSVDREIIAQIIDIARYAASGGNSQPVQWLVIHDPVVVKRIAGLTIDWMRTILNTAHPLAGYVSPVISLWDSGIDRISNNAPHLVFAHIPCHEFIDDPTEGVIAMTYFDITAPSFGVGTCWAGFIKMALSSYKPLQDFLSLPDGRKAVCPMLVGYSAYPVSSIPRRNPVDITWK